MTPPLPWSRYLPLATLLPATLLRAELTNYWPLSETTGTSAPNAVATGVAAESFGSATWANDPVRGDVLQFDGGGSAAAGDLPSFPADQDFTWSFWARSAQGSNNNVIVGNRYPDAGWIKFTTNGFEIRDLPGSYNGFIDYSDFPVNEWVHHTVVKKGAEFTYYRNGLALLSSVVPVDTPGVPLYFGGDQFQENWAGLLDDVATWKSALPLASITALNAGTVNPLTAPLTPPPPGHRPDVDGIVRRHPRGVDPGQPRPGKHRGLDLRSPRDRRRHPRPRRPHQRPVLAGHQRGQQPGVRFAPLHRGGGDPGGARRLGQRLSVERLDFWRRHPLGHRRQASNSRCNEARPSAPAPGPAWAAR